MRSQEECALSSNAMQSLKLVAGRVCKTGEPTISKLKGGYYATVMLIFNLWIKDVEMCIQGRNLNNLEEV